MSKRYDVVLPCLERDMPFLKVTVPRLLDQCGDLGALYLITRKDELSAVRIHLPFEGVNYIDERSVLEIPGGFTVGGWQYQQALKLAALKLVHSKHYMTMDADVFFLRRFHVAEFLQGDRAVYSFHEGEGSFASWYQASSRMLGCPWMNRFYPVTPVLLATPVVEALLHHISFRSIDHLPLRDRILAMIRQVGRMEREEWWRYLLFAHKGWTEYASYFIYAEFTGLIDRWHYLGPTIYDYDHSVWTVDQFSYWQPDRYDATVHAAVVLQSNTKIAVDDFLARLHQCGL